MLNLAAAYGIIMQMIAQGSPKMKRKLLAPIFLGLIISTTSCGIIPDRQKENNLRRMSYSDFIEAVKDKEISRVLISPDNGTAQIVENDGSRSEVNLAPDKDLLKILTENNVDIAVTPTKLANPWQQAISSLIFPVFLLLLFSAPPILIILIILLLRKK